MNDRMTAIGMFDAWIARCYGLLRQRITDNGMLDEDAFHEAYLAVHDVISPGHDKPVFEDLFMQAYKYALKRGYSRECRYTHPDPLFFHYLRTEATMPGAEPEQEKTKDTEVTAKQVDDYVRWHFVFGDYVIFRLKFFDGMSWQGLVDYTGYSSATIARKINGIKEKVRSHFTPPIFYSIANRLFLTTSITAK